MTASQLFVIANLCEIKCSVLSVKLVVCREKVFFFSIKLSMTLGNNHSLNSVFTFKNEFTCDDGSCIPLEKHCDGVPDCPNFSDEGCVLNYPLLDTYDRHRPSGVNQSVNVSVVIHSIPDLDVDNGRITMRLQVCGTLRIILLHITVTCQNFNFLIATL